MIMFNDLWVLKIVYNKNFIIIFKIKITELINILINNIIFYKSENNKTTEY